MSTQVNKVKCSEANNNCLGCKAKGKVQVNQGTCFADDNDNINQGICLACHEQSSFADGNGNVNVNGKDIVNANVNVHGKDIVNGNVNDIVNDNVNGNVNDNVNGNVNGNVNVKGKETVNQGTCFAVGKVTYKQLPSLSDDTYSDSDDTVWSESQKHI